MEILQHGKKQLLTEDKKFDYYFKCPKCGCQFTANINELDSIERRPDGQRTAKCPECGETCLYSNSMLV